MDQWRQAKDPKGRVYYYNLKTRQTTWQKPANFQQPVPATATATNPKASLPPDWKTATTKDGKVYYYNVKTKATSWDPPTKTPPTSSLGQTKTKQHNQTQVTQGETVTVTTITPQRAPHDSFETKYANKSILLQQTTPSQPIPRDLAETHFIEMLKQNEVDATWSFDKIINHLSKQDPRYWELPNDPIRKTQLFETYLLNRSEDQLLRESQEVAKFEVAFRGLLERLFNEGKLLYYTSWTTCRRRLLANEPIYMHSMIGESVKKRCFEELVGSLRAKEEAKRASLKAVALSEVRDYLRSVMFSSSVSSIGTSSGGSPKEDELVSWQTLTKSYLFEKNKRYMANEHFKLLSHEDVLREYLKLLDEKQKEWENELAELNERNYTRDRIARDRFKELLRGEQGGGRDSNNKKIATLIRADTKWTDIYPHLKSDPIFLSLVGRNGSNPVDLFYDVVREKRLVLDGQRSIAQQILISDKFEWPTEEPHSDSNDDKQITVTTQLQNLLKTHRDNELKGIDDYDIMLIVKQLIRQHDEHQQEQRRLAEFKRERRVSAFKKLLTNLLTSHKRDSNSPLPKGTESSSLQWSNVEPLVRETPEFKQLQEDNNMTKVNYEEIFETVKRELPTTNTTTTTTTTNTTTTTTTTTTNTTTRGTKRPISATVSIADLDY